MQFKLKNKKNYQIIRTIDAHTEGEPLRIITEGYPQIVGDTILKKREYLLKNLDHYRQILMFEPRGHADMYGALITEPCTKYADFGILFMHNEGYSSMCGHGIIAAVTVGVETQALQLTQGDEFIGIDAPAGFIRAYAQHDENNDICVSFDNVPSFVESVDQSVLVEGIGEVNYDIAFGGAYYAYVDADAMGISCLPDNAEQLISWGRKIKHAVMAKDTLVHPIEEDLSFLYGTIFYSKHTDSPDSHSRHVCVFADGEVDRSPTGTGVSARAALLRAKEGLAVNQRVVIESIVGGKMSVEIIEACDFEGKDAVIPRVSGRAFITGEHEFLLSAKDIFPQGFIIR